MLHLLCLLQPSPRKLVRIIEGMSSLGVYLKAVGSAQRVWVLSNEEGERVRA